MELIRKRILKMHRIFLTIAALSLIISINVKAQPYVKTNLGIKTTINSITIEIQSYPQAIVRILKCPENISFTKESLSVIKVPQKTAVKLTQHECTYDYFNLEFIWSSDKTIQGIG